MAQSDATLNRDADAEIFIEHLLDEQDGETTDEDIIREYNQSSHQHSTMSAEQLIEDYHHQRR